jgi:hypothetical protein
MLNGVKPYRVSPRNSWKLGGGGFVLAFTRKLFSEASPASVIFFKEKNKKKSITNAKQSVCFAFWLFYAQNSLILAFSEAVWEPDHDRRFLPDDSGLFYLLLNDFL